MPSCFYFHIFKLLFATNLFFYLHLPFKPCRRFVFKPKYWTNLFKYIFFVLSFCLLLHYLGIRISLAFYDFLQVITVLIRHHSTVCHCGLAWYFIFCPRRVAIFWIVALLHNMLCTYTRPEFDWKIKTKFLLLPHTLRKQPTFRDAPTGFPPNDVCGTTAEIPYWWLITTHQIWVSLCQALR